MKKHVYALGCAAAVCLAGGCDDDDDLGYQTVSVSFAVSEVGMEGSSAEVGLKLSRAAKEDLKVTVAMTSTEVSVSDLVFTPALEDGKLVVSIPTGATTASFQVAKAAGRDPRRLDAVPDRSDFIDRGLQDRNGQRDETLVLAHRFDGQRNAARRQGRRQRGRCRPEIPEYRLRRPEQQPSGAGVPQDVGPGLLLRRRVPRDPQFGLQDAGGRFGQDRFRSRHPGGCRCGAQPAGVDDGGQLREECRRHVGRPREDRFRGDCRRRGGLLRGFGG